MNTYTNKYKKYNKIYNLLVKELKKTKTNDIDFIFGSKNTAINKIENRYILTYEPKELLRFYKNNTFCDYSRFKPRDYNIKRFFIVVLYHELGHRYLGHCESNNDINNPIYQNLYKKIGHKAVYLYPEVIQKQADNYAINKIKEQKEVDRLKNLCYTLYRDKKERIRPCQEVDR